MQQLKKSIKEYHLTHHGIHDLYKIPTPVFIELTNKNIICRWGKNREEDKKRVETIKKYVTSKGYIDGIISLAFIGGKLQCYDGNHRRMSIVSKLDPILVNILWEGNEQVIINEFNMINRSVSVPEIYFSNNEEVKNVINEHVRKFCNDYADHCSASKNCKAPNFNRDAYTDNITKLLDREPFSTYDIAILLGFINILNDCYKNNELGFGVKDKIKSVKNKEKCEKSGLWLFSLQRDIDEKHLKKVITHYNKTK